MKVFKSLFGRYTRNWQLRGGVGWWGRKKKKKSIGGYKKTFHKTVAVEDV